MGRRRTKNRDLPPGVHRKGGRMYYGRNDIPLGPDGPEAWDKWAALRGDAKIERPTFADAVREFTRRELHKRAPNTQASYRRSFALLSQSFPMPLDEIEPGDIQDFLDERPPIAGTRDKAAFSLVFNFARARRMTKAPNPAAGIRGTKSKRDVYVTDDMLLPVLVQCDPDTADYVELVYRSGADAGVAALWRAESVRDGSLHVRRTKTGVRAQIGLSGPIAEIIARRLAGRVGNVYLFARTDGRPIGLQTFQRRFAAARDAVGQSFWLKDLRAKAASDSSDIKAAQALLGHADETTTAIYRRQRIGERADPITRELRKSNGIAENDEPK
jgi:integrase